MYLKHRLSEILLILMHRIYVLEEMHKVVWYGLWEMIMSLVVNALPASGNLWWTQMESWGASDCWAVFKCIVETIFQVLNDDLLFNNFCRLIFLKHLCTSGEYCTRSSWAQHGLTREPGSLPYFLASSSFNYRWCNFSCQHAKKISCWAEERIGHIVSPHGKPEKHSPCTSLCANNLPA